MSTTAQVNISLDEIEKVINSMRGQGTQAKAALVNANAQLGALATTYAAIITAINAYTPDGALETLQQDRLAKLITEFTALKAEIASGVTDLADYSEY